MKVIRIINRQRNIARQLIAALIAVCTFVVCTTAVFAGDDELEQIAESMVFIKGGCFRMGNTFDGGDKDEKPAHKVCVDNYYLGKYEVTNRQFVVFLNEVNKRNVNRELWFTINEKEHCYISGDIGHYRIMPGYEDHPVACISWHGATEFTEWVSKQTGYNYRLPTEAEWEYAARSGGRQEKWSGTSHESKLDEYAWYTDNSGDKTHPVGQRKPNAFGLYDMSGNIWEWVQDWHEGSYYQKCQVNNPVGPLKGTNRVVRGGCCDNPPKVLRTANRVGYTPVGRGFDIGFRLAMTP